jgi:hypothetical protein
MEEMVAAETERQVAMPLPMLAVGEAQQNRLELILQVEQVGME